jgi:DegV family protein with EDD domain
MAAKCNLIVDSCCDFTAAQVKEAGLVCLPFTYTEANKPDGGFHGDDDLFQSRSVHEFYETIRKGAAPLTSQPSQAVYERAFRDALKSGIPTVCLCLSTGISGAYNGASIALDRIKEEKGEDKLPIYVVDSLQGSTTLNLLLHETIHQRDRGLSAEELVAWIQDARYKTHTIFQVDNLDTLHHGGRVPKSVAVVAGLLEAKPLLTWKLDGSLTFLGVARGRKKALRRMCSYYVDNHRDNVYGHVVAIGDADCPEIAEELADRLRKFDPELRVLRSTIGPTIGCHVGPGMFSCCFWGEDRREGRYSDLGNHKVKGIRQQ